MRRIAAGSPGAGRSRPFALGVLALLLGLAALSSTPCAADATVDDHCRPHQPAGGETGPDAFYAESTCSYRCTGAGSPLARATRGALLDPEALGLRLADGGLRFAALTTHLELLGDRTCIEAAAGACGGITRIAEARFDGMRSGDWSMPPRLTCDPDQAAILSPYDLSFGEGGLRTTAPASEEAGGGSRIPSLSVKGKLISPRPPSVEEFRESLGDNLLPEDLERLKAESDHYVEASGCAAPITVESCFGDCNCEPTDGRGCVRESILLGSPRSNARNTTVLCGDALLKEIRARGLASASPDVIRYYCRDYAIRTLTEDAPVTSSASRGVTCAAFRARFDCDAVISALPRPGRRGR